MKVVRGKHKKALEILALHPEYIGISKKEIITASIEQVLYHKGKIFAEVDLVYELKDGSSILVEYKGNGNQKAVKKGKKQIDRGIYFYEKIKKVSVEGKLVTGDSIPKLKKGNSSKQKYRNFYNKPKNIFDK